MKTRRGHRLATVLFFFLSFAVSAPAASYDEELKLLSSNMGNALEKAGLKTIAFGPFKGLDSKETNLGKLLAEELSVELVNQNRGVTVVDRSNLNRLMEEYKLTEEGLIEPENTKKLKLAGIDALIFGTIVPFENTYRVQLKAVATDSAKVVAATRSSINESESLNALMGVSRLQIKTPGSSVQLSGEPVGAKPTDSKEKKIYTLGKVDFEITSLIFQRKSGKVRVTYTATERSGNRTEFEYALFDKNAPDVDLKRYNAEYARRKVKPDYALKGEAVDDKGQSYALLVPSDATSRPQLDPDTPVAFSLEYKIVADGGSTIQVPENINLWFEFYLGRNTKYKFSVAEYPIEKIQ